MLIPLPQIERLPRDTSFEFFFEHYFEPNIPVIIADASAAWPANQKWNRTYLLAELRRDHVDVNKLWFSADGSFLRQDYEVPELVRRCLDPTISHTRPKNFRIWINNPNHLTPFHSDTNGLYVFNVQVTGTKRWQLLDPDAPLDLYAFTQFPHLKYNRSIPDDLAPYLWECRLQASEMIFVPAFWYHKVLSESETINVNWVGTKRRQPDNRLHRREREILKAALALRPLKGVDTLIDLLIGTNEHDYLQHYAGTGGVEFVRSLTAAISPAAAMRRLLLELLKLPVLARDLAEIRRYQENPLDALAAAGAP